MSKYFTQINQLWEDLSHPPPMFLAQGRFREADGSGNNPAYPSLGAAGTRKYRNFLSAYVGASLTRLTLVTPPTAYARSVPKMHPSPNNLPDPTIVFDALLKRDGFTPHPSGISSLLFSFATLIIHSAFETNQKDPHINDTSSYLDLSPLYGNSQAEQDTVRSKEHGRLYPDGKCTRLHYERSRSFKDLRADVETFFIQSWLHAASCSCRHQYLLSSSRSHATTTLLLRNSPQLMKVVASPRFLTASLRKMTPTTMLPSLHGKTIPMARSNRSVLVKPWSAGNRGATAD